MEPRVQKTLHPTQEFGPCLREILKEKQVSASELARMMNYKSRNSIFRILSGKGGHGARQTFCERLLNEYKIATVPGTAFGECGEGHIRCSYATGVEKLNIALESMSEFVDKCGK